MHHKRPRRAATDRAETSAQETVEISELEVLKEIRDALIHQRGPVTAGVNSTGAGTVGSASVGPQGTTP